MNSLTDCLEHWAAVNPDWPFLGQRIGDSWTVLSYGEVLRRTAALAHSLAGVKRCTITGRNSLDHALLALACLRAHIPFSVIRPGRPTAGPESSAAKTLYTSGSTGEPKAVAYSETMLVANQRMLRVGLGQAFCTRPVLCDWLPWSHAYGGNHNFNFALCNGGTFYICGRRTLDFDVSPTAYFSVPSEYRWLLGQLREDDALRGRFFRELRFLFTAAAVLDPQIAEELEELASETVGRRIPMIVGYGATETCPAALLGQVRGKPSGYIGRPLPGIEQRLSGDEIWLRGPTVIANASDGWFRTGDAARRLADGSGYVFQGRIGQDFKLANGDWVRAAPLRARLLAHFAPLLADLRLEGANEEMASVVAVAYPEADQLLLRKLLTEWGSIADVPADRICQLILVSELYRKLGLTEEAGRPGSVVIGLDRPAESSRGGQQSF